MTSEIAYAIDFGTSNSLLAAASKTETFKPIAIDPKAKDSTVFRSLLYFPHMDQCFYGAEAIEEYIANDMQGRMIRSIKKFLPKQSFIGTFIEDRPLHLEEIISLFLKRMRETANEHFQQDGSKIVLGRPAKFSNKEEEDRFAESRFKSAAKKAGFKDILFLAEPLAAAHSFQHQLTETKTVLIADFGGGTSDFSIVRMNQNTKDALDVLAVGGLSIAGDAFDSTIMKNDIVDFFGGSVEYQTILSNKIMTMPQSLKMKLCSPADISVLLERDTLDFLKQVEQSTCKKEDNNRMKRLFALLNDQLGFKVFDKIEGCKRELGKNALANFQFEYPDLSFDYDIEQRDFIEYSQNLVEKIMHSLDETLQTAGISTAEIDIVCCTGGTAKIIHLQKALLERFSPDKMQNYNYFHAVVEGLAKFAQEKFF